MQPLSVPQPVRTEELAPAFRLLFRHLPTGDRDNRVLNALRLVESGDIDRRGLFVLRQPVGLAGALLCSPVPGASGILWPPAVIEEGGEERRIEREDALVRHAFVWLREQGAKLAQVLLAPDEEELAGPLVRNGMAHVTNLWYLHHDLVLSATDLAAPARATFEPFDPARPGPFEEALFRTYEHTLDCPEVNGVRTPAEVLEGHRAQGIYDPNRWWLARAGGPACDPVGVVIVAELPECGAWEIAYMGVVPEARRRGYGRELLHKVLWEARAAGAPRVTLSVDARNRPAWELYRGVGLEPFDRRAVYLAVWR
jgi:ribosomal protein S18 acetylase RimI-like enzyme